MFYICSILVPAKAGIKKEVRCDTGAIPVAVSFIPGHPGKKFTLQPLCRRKRDGKQ